jgi:hypothetical protein
MKQTKDSAFGKKLSLKERLELEEAFILKCPGEVRLFLLFVHERL